jgi:Family of unknown function (DUF6084)
MPETTRGRPAGGSNGTAPAAAADPAGSPARPDPSFEVVGADIVAGSSTPTLGFELAVSDESGVEIQFIVLSVLVTVEPGRRAYDHATRERLVELFGEPERWGSTTGSFRWTQVDTVIGAFTGHGRHRLTIEFTYDHEIAATKYFGGVGDGFYPLQFHFNGTTYYRLADGRLQMLPLAWDRSAAYELPVATWRRMISSHYPEGAWLRLSEETLQRLGQFKARSGQATIDACVRELLERADGSERRPGGRS